MVYSFRVAAMEEIATERSTGCGASAGTSFLSSVGAATLIILPLASVLNVLGCDIRLWFGMLNKQRRELRLGYDRQLRVCSPDIAFPVGILCRIGRCEIRGKRNAGERWVGIPFVAGVEYFSGRDAGGGKRWIEARGRPVDISGLITVTSPKATG